VFRTSTSLFVHHEPPEKTSEQFHMDNSTIVL
jgi:hypothetical protein